MASIIDFLGKPIGNISNYFPIAEIVIPEEKPEGEPRYLELPEMGVSIVIDEKNHIECIQLYSKDAAEEYEKFTGELIFGVDFSFSRERVRSILAKPVAFDNGGEGKGLFGGFLKPWDLFSVDNYNYHFEYTNDGSAINLISLSLANGGSH